MHYLRLNLNVMSSDAFALADTITNQAWSKLNLSGPARACARAHLLGGSGGMPPRNFRRSEIDSGTFWDTCLSWQGTCYK